MKRLLLPPFVMLFSIVVMIILNEPIPIVRFWETHLCWLGLSMIIIGLATAQWHARLFRKLGTNINTFGNPDVLATGGLFKITRNPMYLGFLFVLTGVWIVLGSASPLIVLVGFFLLTNYWYVPIEERAMRLKFGERYVDYKSKVRRWL